MKLRKTCEAKETEKMKIKPKEKLRRKRYQKDNIIKALEAVHEGMSKKLAAKTYQVPRTTLIYRLQNPQHNARPGPATLLTEAQENDLEEWINNCAKKGFPKRKDDVINSVSTYLKKKQKLGKFTNGEKWFKLFLQRHPNLSFRTPESVTAASAAVSENDIRGWFKQIEDHLQENNLFYIVLSDPSRVFNGDETNFLLCPKTGVVLAPKGHKNVYEVDNAPAKTSLTVMFTFCADGRLTPPMVIFPNKRLSADISSKVPPDWGIGLSDNGWMKSEIFYDYIESVFYPHLVKSGTKFPIILFVDGHKTHLTFAVSELCTKLNIVLIALYPNCTRLLQPADVSAFKPLKYGWQKSVLEWRRNHPSEALTKNNFVPLLQSTIEKWITTSTIVNGFRATGLCPWDVNAIDFTKCLGKNTDCKKANNQVERKEKVLTKEEFIRLIGNSKMAELERNTLTSEDNYLQKIWNFFKGNEIFSTDMSNCINVSKENDTAINSIAIEHMRVVISEDDYPLDETVSKFIPESHEVTDSNCLGNSNTNTECPSQDTQFVTITHSAEVYYENINVSREKTPRKPEHFKQEKIIQSDVQQDFNQIEVLEDRAYPTVRIPKSILSKCTPVKLQDILVLPKTPQRKGVKNIKRAPFVLTSAEWKAQENEKIKIKEEKAEGIKKRKEEREKKKEQEKINKAQKNNNKEKPKKKNTSKKIDDVRKLLFSDEFYRMETFKKSPQKQEDKENSQKSLFEEDCEVTSKTNKVFTVEEIERFLTDYEG